MVKVTFWLTKPKLIGCVKLKEEVAPAVTETGVKPGVELTPPAAVLTHVTPQVTSKVSDGLIVDDPTIRTTTIAALAKGLATATVQV